MPNNKKFLNITLNNEDENECSPVQNDPSLLGIMINAPQRVSIGTAKRDDIIEYSKVPICGFLQLEILKTRNAGPMMLTAANINSGEIFNGPITLPTVEDDIEPMPDEIANLPADNDEELEGIVVANYFNPNLTDFVAIPKKAATYQVTVTIGEYTSNMVEIEFFE